MSIYTRTGDGGKTKILGNNGETVSIEKSSLLIDAIGNLDEVNSYIGLILSTNSDLHTLLIPIQRDIFVIGSILSGAKLAFDIEKVRLIEKNIDELEAKLPVLSNFVLPGGSVLSSQYHCLRTIIRRTERSISKIMPDDRFSIIFKYINRLSDYFFVLARNANMQANQIEQIWKPDK